MDLPAWKRALLCIPKNLVYVFAAIIVVAFAGMMYITYSDKDIQDFLEFERTQEVIDIAPLFKHLRQYLELTKEVEIAQNLNVRQFNQLYLNKNKPVVIVESCD